MPHDLADASSAQRSSPRRRAGLAVGVVWLLAAGVFGALVGDGYGAAPVFGGAALGMLARSRLRR